MARSASTWTGARSVYRRRLLTDVGIRGFIRSPIFVNDATGFFGLIFSNEDDTAANSRKHVLSGVGRGDIGIDPGGLEQTADDQRLRLAFGIKHFYDLLFGYGPGARSWAGVIRVL